MARLKDLEVPKAERPFQEVYFTSRDGLRLHARHYPAPGSPRRTLLCLPGLTRNARDFERLATLFSSPAAHRRTVYCLDYRGRGRSEYDEKWENYTPYIEALDVLDFLTQFGLHDVAVLGTSRGGIIAMLLATLRPTSVHCAILNDIGPAIEADGLARIIGYVGRIPAPTDWEEAMRLVRDMNKRDFPNLPDSEWRAIARQWFNDSHGAPISSYDPNLGKAITNVDLGDGPPDMWPQFAALSNKPVLTIRGKNSDILSRGTVKKMGQEHPAMETHEVLDQGHAPFLRDDVTLAVIQEFLMRHDQIPAGPFG
ncbi:MAG: alpha/beta hydrolase [Pseudomonadota bacterium]